jgi:cell shape-determining protein MreC
MSFDELYGNSKRELNGTQWQHQFFEAQQQLAQSQAQVQSLQQQNALLSQQLASRTSSHASITPLFSSNCNQSPCTFYRRSSSSK